MTTDPILTQRLVLAALNEPHRQNITGYCRYLLEIIDDLNQWIARVDDRMLTERPEAVRVEVEGEIEILKAELRSMRGAVYDTALPTHGDGATDPQLMRMFGTLDTAVSYMENEFESDMLRSLPATVRAIQKQGLDRWLISRADFGERDHLPNKVIEQYGTFSKLIDAVQRRCLTQMADPTVEPGSDPWEAVEIGRMRLVFLFGRAGFEADTVPTERMHRARPKAVDLEHHDQELRAAIPHVVAAARQAQQQLQRRGFGKLWYGQCFVGTDLMLSNLQVWYRAQQKFNNAAGSYTSDTDTIDLYRSFSGRGSSDIVRLSKDRLADVMVHEVGHRLWFKTLSSGQRAEFQQLMQDVRIGHVSEYAKTNTEEAFAELFMYIVGGGDVQQDWLDEFRRLLGQSGLRVTGAVQAAAAPVSVVLVPTLTFVPVTRSVFRTIQAEGLDEETGETRSSNWLMATLPLSELQVTALQEMSDAALEAWNAFDIELKQRYAGRYVDLIDYDAGTVTVVCLRSAASGTAVQAAADEPTVRTERDLIATFEQLNQELFENRLPRPQKFTVDRKSQPVAGVEYRMTGDRQAPIAVNYLRASGRYRYTDQMWLNIICHEMIHLDVTWKDYGSHGPLFRARCDEIQRQTGGRVAPPHREVSTTELIPERQDAGKRVVVVWYRYPGKDAASVLLLSPATYERSRAEVAGWVERFRVGGREVGVLESTAPLLDKYPTTRKLGGNMKMFRLTPDEWTAVQQAGKALPMPEAQAGAAVSAAVTAAAAKKISLQEAKDRKLFGPVYHGTTDDGRQRIREDGFRPGGAEDSRHGYPNQPYAPGLPPAPQHHLGYGVYLTTSRTIAKQYNGGTERGLVSYYLDVPRLETINFSAAGTMMKWWQRNGYDGDLARTDRVAATEKLTQSLSSRFDAVWFKGKGLTRLLDGDQICCYDPSRIYEIDPKLSSGCDAGAKVRRKSDGMRGVVLSAEPAQKYRDRFASHTPGQPHPWVRPETNTVLVVKWQRGGREAGVQDVDVEPVQASAAAESVTAAAKLPPGVTADPQTGGAVYYRGSVPGDSHRIRTGADAWDSYLFVANDPALARDYGRNIERVVLKPAAKILTEGTAEFRKAAGVARRSESMLDFCARTAAAAQANGYDAVHYRLQGTVGTAIMNRAIVALREPYVQAPVTAAANPNGKDYRLSRLDVPLTKLTAADLAQELMDLSENVIGDEVFVWLVDTPDACEIHANPWHPGEHKSLVLPDEMRGLSRKAATVLAQALLTEARRSTTANRVYAAPRIRPGGSVVYPKYQQRRGEFLRFGDIPPEEKSSNGLNKKTLPGVSCYRFTEQDGKYTVQIPEYDKHNSTYWGFPRAFKEGRYTAYVIDALEIGRGPDGEPLVTDVKIRKHLKPGDIVDPVLPKFVGFAGGRAGVLSSVQDIQHTADLQNVTYTNPQTGRTAVLPEQWLAAVSVSAGQWAPGQYSACHRMHTDGDFSYSLLLQVQQELAGAVPRAEQQLAAAPAQQHETIEQSLHQLLRATTLLDTVVRRIRHIE